MDALVARYFWIVRWGGWTVAIAFAASATSTFVGTEYLLSPADSTSLVDKDEEDEGKRPKSRKRSGADAKKRDTSKFQESIVASNIFCPTCVPVVEAPVDGAAPVRPGEIKSSLPLALLATMESDDPKYSMATIQDSQSFVLGSYSPDDMIQEGVTLKTVERGRITLLNGRQVEYIDMDGAPPPPRQAIKPPEPHAPPPKSNPRHIEGAAEAINCSGDNCVVERAFVEKLLANPASLGKQARVVPAVKDGETRGFKFYGIRSGSLPKLLGLKNGDLLMSVNGSDLKSIDQALGLYTKLRSASNLSVVLERKGKTVNKEIEIK